MDVGGYYFELSGAATAFLFQATKSEIPSDLVLHNFIHTLNVVYSHQATMQ
jgi:hypothetical protein